MTTRHPEPVPVTLARHEQILQEQGKQIDGLTQDVRVMAAGNGEVMEMFGKIMGATTHTADQVISLKSAVRDQGDRMNQGFAQVKVDQDRVCALKHGALEQRIGTVEQGKVEIAKRVEDMGENTKLTYIRNLEAQRDQAVKTAESTTTQKTTQLFEWKKLWFVSIVGVIMAVVGAGLTYTVTVAAKKAETQHPPASSSVVVR